MFDLINTIPPIIYAVTLFAVVTAGVQALIEALR